MKNETLLFILIKLLSVCFFIGGCFSSTFYKSATVEKGKGSSGIAVGFSTMQYSNETLYDGSSIKNLNRTCYPIRTIEKTFA